MHTPKIVFFDIDGTLIDIETKKISERTLETLKHLKEKGILICLATGRTPMTLPVFPGITFDAYVTFNGSLCFTEDQDLFSNPIPADDVQTLIKNATRLGRPVSLATRTALATNGTDKDLTDYYAIARLPVPPTDHFEELCRQEVYQFMLGCRKDEYAALLEGVKGSKIAAWWDRAADIIPANGGKGIGIQKVLEHFGIPRENSYAFGDGNNDIEMLQAVGTGIAMGNASPELKSIATEICRPCSEDGIYHYFL